MAELKLQLHSMNQMVRVVFTVGMCKGSTVSPPIIHVSPPNPLCGIPTLLGAFAGELGAWHCRYTCAAHDGWCCEDGGGMLPYAKVVLPHQ